ncbi:hypothetical protein pb186bvf_004915 [Paramecium bursaria]
MNETQTYLIHQALCITILHNKCNYIITLGVNQFGIIRILNKEVFEFLAICSSLAKYSQYIFYIYLIQFIQNIVIFLGRIIKNHFQQKYRNLIENQLINIISLINYLYIVQ